jgi:polyferredoxin
MILSFFLIPLGYYQKWEWVKNKYYRLIHLVLMGIIFIETILGFMCPLTILENFLRNDIEINNKITQIIHQIMYWDLPTYQFIILYLLSLLYLIFLWFFFKPDFKK